MDKKDKPIIHHVDNYTGIVPYKKQVVYVVNASDAVKMEFLVNGKKLMQLEVSQLQLFTVLYISLVLVLYIKCQICTYISL